MSYTEELRAWANERVAEHTRQQQNQTIEKSTVLGTFKSKTSKAIYKVTKHLGNIRCNCPGFVFRRNCRHITEVV